MYTHELIGTFGMCACLCAERAQLGGALDALKFRCTQRDSLSELLLQETISVLYDSFVCVLPFLSVCATMPYHSRCKGKSLRDSEKLREVVLCARARQSFNHSI